MQSISDVLSAVRYNVQAASARTPKEGLIGLLLGCHVTTRLGLQKVLQAAYAVCSIAKDRPLLSASDERGSQPPAAIAQACRVRRASRLVELQLLRRILRASVLFFHALTGGGAAPCSRKQPAGCRQGRRVQQLAALVAA